MGRAWDYGRSAQGRPLVCVEVGEGERLVTVTAGIHGLEFIGVEVALAVLAAGPIDGTRLRVCPVLNPDGYARTWDSGGDAALGELRCNANGVDLNRNFPMPFGGQPSRTPWSGSSNPAAATYRGSAPLSEPESRALVALLQEDVPHASANLHSFMGSLICARVWQWDDWMGYRSLCRSFRSGQRTSRGYFRLGVPVFDVFTGELEDWQHHVAGTWAVCVECFSWRESLRQHLRAPSVFCRFNPAAPAGVIRRDAGGVRAMLRDSLTQPRPPRRPAGQRVLSTWSARSG